jgi:hypothetical protein
MYFIYQQLYYIKTYVAWAIIAEFLKRPKRGLCIAASLKAIPFKL